MLYTRSYGSRFRTLHEHGCTVCTVHKEGADASNAGFKRIPLATKNAGAIDRRSQILSAASTLVERRGYYGTSLRMIAREAGITPSLLQKYFPAKEDILEAFVEHAAGEFDVFTTGVQKIIATTEEPERMMSMIGLRFVDFVDRMRGFYLTWMMCPELVEPYSEALPEFITLTHKIVAHKFAQRTGIGEAAALHCTVIFFSSLFTWTIFYNRAIPKYSRLDNRETRVARLVDMLMRSSANAEEALILA